MSFTAKSVILDIADNWGDTSYLGLRSVDFWSGGTKISLVDTDFTTYATSEYSGTYHAENVFDTSLSKTGSVGNNEWISNGFPTNQRLIVVFNTSQTFDGIRINNSHTSGGSTVRGAKNVVIHYSTDSITSTTYNASISNSTKIFDGWFDEHAASDAEDEQTLALSSPDFIISLPPFALGLALDAGNIIGDAHTTLSPLEMGLSIDTTPTQAIVALSPLEMGLTFDGTPMQSIPVQPFQIGLSTDMGGVSSFETGSAIIRYLCILTGAADGTTDLTLPMASFQARRRSGDPTYLSVVIPTVDYAAQIAARPNGTLKIQQAYEQNGVIKQTETIMETTLDEVSPDEGGSNQSTTLTGYSTSTYSAKAVTLSGVTYRTTRAGKYRYRLARPYIFLNPGDTVTFSEDGVVFVVDTMNYFINATTATIELASA